MSYVRCKQTAKLLTLTGFLCSFTNERSELKFIAFFGWKPVGRQADVGSEHMMLLE